MIYWLDGKLIRNATIGALHHSILPRSIVVTAGASFPPNARFLLMLIAVVQVKACTGVFKQRRFESNISGLVCDSGMYGFQKAYWLTPNTHWLATLIHGENQEITFLFVVPSVYASAKHSLNTVKETTREKTLLLR
jgi:hypothetical protein